MKGFKCRISVYDCGPLRHLSPTSYPTPCKCFKCSVNDSQVPFWYIWNNGMIRKTQINSSLSLETETFDSDALPTQSCLM